MEAVRAFAASWTAKQGGGLFRRGPKTRRRSDRGSTSTAGSASARPTCSRRSGTSRPDASTSARFIEVHGARRCPRLRGGGAPPVRRQPHRDRRVRARRPGRHHAHVALPRRAGERRHAPRRDLQHPAERARGGSVRRCGLPPRDPGALRPLHDDPHRWARLPAARLGGVRGRGRRRRRGRRCPTRPAPRSTTS